jgi:hypothetical protein
MRTLILSLAATASAAIAGPMIDGPARAATPAVSQHAADALAAAESGRLWQGRRYCWYPTGWRGPGWYWCGYRFRRGHGWGGPIGWHGWQRPGHHRPGIHPPKPSRPGINPPKSQPRT